MSIGYFTDKKHQPTENEVATTIGPMLPVWKIIVQFIRDNYPIQEGLNIGMVRSMDGHCIFKSMESC